MNGHDLFKVDRSADRLNENFFRMFGKKINLENFDLDKLQDARNRLRTQISQIRNQSNFNETVENDAYLQAKMMLDAINAEIAERDEHIIEAEADDDLVMRVEDFLAGWMEAADDHEEYEVHGELVDLADNFDKHRDIHKLRDEIKGLAPLGEFYKSLLMFLNKEFKKDLAKSEDFDADVAEGQMSEIDIDLHMLAREEDEDKLIDALRGDMGQAVADVLNDMMEELKDELASKGMNDVMRDDDKMIEMLMDKLVDEFGEGDFDPTDEGGETDDDYALASAGFGSDEDYESINNEVSPPGFKGTVKAMKKHKDIDNPYALAWHMKKKGYKSHKKADGSDKNESVEQGEEMTTLREGEVQQASAIVTAKTMVDRVGRWIEELSGMENETLLQLGDSIRDEMGQEQSRAFIEQVAPAIQSALETLKGTRETLSSGVNTLATGEQPADMLGAEPAPEADTEGDMTEPAPEVEEPAGDEFSAAEPAAGGAEAAGREQRESIQFQNRLMKMLAG